MKKRVALVTLITLIFFTQATAEEQLKAIALTMTDYLTAGRVVIANNQPLINDSAKGEKNFTPEVYEDQVSLEFMKMSDIVLKNLAPSDDFNKALIAIHESAKEVIAEAQTQINKSDKDYKGFIPAVFGRRVGDKLFKRTGIVIKQTSLKYRGDYNKPDDFEISILKKFETGGIGSSYEEETKFGNTRVLRYMAPLYIEKSCLPCHGEPAGERDIAGRLKEGYKEGELRGAISVIVPIKCILDNS